ncbi:uncharacterized protein K02A2.6-like [Uloborus diversus]|uniref:uncharacterized protein K02A2.6-like n=1 Tax=Uloborus diversus TaxID=327109 RepID=UPI00240A2B8F|nr:uncharacterized protein K02A2.6-like [Uloborus diversus]
MVPKQFQSRVLQELHEGHLGIVKMKAIARSFVFWKNIDKDIEEAVKNCVHCAQIKTDPQKAKVHHWEYPSKPWERLHVDFAGPLFGYMYLIIVDAHSKWLEAYPMKNTTALKTIECLRDCFARFGLPLMIVSDNGPQFKSDEFKIFLSQNGIKHRPSAPFKPSSNGQAERYVFTVKQSLRAMKEYPGTIQQKLSTFLMQYRKAPNMTTLHSPAMLLMKREIRTRIDLVKPDLHARVQDRIRKDNFQFSDRVFRIGDNVAVRNYRHGDKRWKFGKVVSKDGQLHYTINVNGQLWRRHVDQMRDGGNLENQEWERIGKAPNLASRTHCSTATTAADATTNGSSAEPPAEPVVLLANTNQAEPAMDGNTTAASPVSPTADPPLLRRSTRSRKAPQRLDL